MRILVVTLLVVMGALGSPAAAASTLSTAQLPCEGTTDLGQDRD